ncbi:MAG: glycosyltransferase family 2 protein [Porticoccaceae bacterium]
MSATLIDVVVPVYRGLDATRRCLESVLASCCVTDFELIVIDDASPDPELSVWLDEMAAAGRIRLHRNPENLGFVATVNRAMALHPERDAVLLNSDTQVANDWLDRLRACAGGDARIGTVTPFSNNGSICSYPNVLEVNPLPAGWPLAELDALFAVVNAGQCLDLPTGVGFCLYLRRDCWAALGGFDLDRFPRGYGEETDFCMRAAKAGWRNVLCADVFVFHEGSVSFGEERAELMDQGAAAMAELHPEYHELVMRFLRADPVRPSRDAVTRARGRRLLADCAAALEDLMAEHDSGAAWLSDKLVARARDAAELAAAFADAERFVREREADVRQLQQRLAMERQQFEELLARSEMLQRQLAELQAHHQAVINSRTWRWSRRLRRLLRLD